MKSPFKFLDAYSRQDKEIFFGRAEEIDQLYTLVFQTKLLLVYGQSGTGKTSLIQCGLANRFKPTDWFELFVRRKDNINASLNREIRKHAEAPIADEATVAEAIQSLYLDRLRPVYLIFDQFEELFILGSKEEQQIFIHTIAALLKSEVACRIIFVMREEYIAMLYDFERAVPTLFNKRFRVEPMSLHNVQRVIASTTAAFGIGLEDGDKTAQHIIDNLSDHRAGVQLSYLQVYLDKLYREATDVQRGYVEGKTAVVFTELIVQRTGALGDVMADFLEEQTTVIQKALRTQFPETPVETVQHVLEEFATLEGTKQPMTRSELSAKLLMLDLTVNLNPIIDACLAALENSRILRHVESVYELAHDTLAGHIAEKRSVESKNLLKVQKLIKDRYSAYEQTHTLLNKEELGFIGPYLTKFVLNDEESQFIIKSQTTVNRKKKQIISLTIGIMAVLAGLTIWAFIQKHNADSSAQTAERQKIIADSLRGIADSLRLVTESSAYKKFTTTKDASLEPETLPFAQLQQIMPRAPEPILREFSAAFNKNLRILSEINTPKRLSAFLAQIAYESAQLTYLEENVSYSASTLMKVFPRYFSDMGKAQQYEKKPEKIANYVYANKMGNGDEASGDGWKYRGRGILQIFGRDNYRKFQEILGYDLLANPDQAGTIEVSTAMACQFWNSKGLNQLADAEELEAITRRIIGGLRGYEDRLRYYNVAKKVLKVVPMTHTSVVPMADTTVKQPQVKLRWILEDSSYKNSADASGNVTVKFILDESGKIKGGKSGIRIVQSDTKSLEKYAIREALGLVYKPATRGSKNVESDSVRYTFKFKK